MSVQKRIREARKAKGLSQSELARIVGVRPQSVQQWEKDGGTSPKRARLSAVADALGVTIGRLLEDERATEKTPGDIANEIAEIIDSAMKRYRHGKGITQAALARVSGVPQPTISRTLKGKTIPETTTLYRLLSSLGVDGKSLPSLPLEESPLDIIMSAEDRKLIDAIMELPQERRSALAVFLNVRSSTSPQAGKKSG